MNKFFVFTTTIILGSCCAQHKATITSITKTNMVADGKMFTAFYQQQAADYSALCYQAYNLARLRLDQALQTTNIKPRAIITDIDETVLNNSPYAVHQSLLNKDYDFASWMDWVNLAKADTLAGTVSFFRYAASKNVEVFYITNRGEKEKPGTLKNLQLYNFPFADSAHVIMRQNTSSKESRRQAVAANYDIVLFLGDNMSDFSDLFDKKTPAERLQNVQSSSALFGSKFIVLPNSNYGDWEGAQYEYNFKLSMDQKDSSIKSVLKSY